MNRCSSLLGGVKNVALGLEAVLSAGNKAVLKAGGYGAVSIAFHNSINNFKVNNHRHGALAAKGAPKFK